MTLLWGNKILFSIYAMLQLNFAQYISANTLFPQEMLSKNERFNFNKYLYC